MGFDLYDTQANSLGWYVSGFQPFKKIMISSKIELLEIYSITWS
jgi:hypothetical protein